MKKHTKNAPMHGNDPLASDAESVNVAGSSNNAARCVAKSKRSGQRCRNPRVAGRDVCRMHGGKSLSGPAHPQWKSRPERYAEIFGIPPEAMEEAHLLILNPDIAAIDARILELAQRIKAQQPSWSAIQEAFASLEAAMKAEDTLGMRAAFVTLKDLLTGGAGSERQWSSIARLLDTKRKLIESERKRALEANLYLTREQAAAFGHALLEAVARNVQDHAAIVRITNDIRLLNDALSVERTADLPERVQ